MRIAPGLPVGQGGMTVHPVVSYTYLKWDGGHDELREVGSGYSASTSGWSLSPLAGIPVGTSKWGLNFYAAAGLSHYGGNGVNVRFGVDLQPWFLKR